MIRKQTNKVTQWDLALTLLHGLKWMFLLFLLIYTISPVLWTLLSSLKSNQQIFANAFGWPDPIQWSNYENAWQLDSLFSSFRNTFLVAGFSTAANLLFAAMASYAMLNRFRFSNHIYTLLIIGIFIPVNTFIIPYYVLSLWLNLYNTIWMLILTYTSIGLPLSVLILKGYMDTVPKELFEAAHIDGAGYIYVFAKVAFPLSIPGMATIGIFQFIGSWNEFLFATILTQGPAAMTLQVAMRFFLGTFTVDFASFFATVIIILIPMIIVYALMQEQVISGLTSGALKG